MLWLCLALLAGAASDTDPSLASTSELVPPDAHFAGEFAQAPVHHWSMDLPGGRYNAATHTERTRPVVVGEHLLVGSAAGDALYMLSRRNGDLVREFSANGAVQAEPVVFEDRVVFSDSGGSTWCYALDGELIWRHNSGAPILVRPTVDAQRIYVTNVEDLALALDVRTGDLVWQYRRRTDPTRETELALYAAPAAVSAEGWVLFGFSDGSLVALEGDDGDVIWDVRVGEGRYPDLVAAPVIQGNDVYASGYFRPLVAIDKVTQNVRWRLDYGAANAGMIDSGGGPAVLYHPGTDGHLRAVVALTGAELWAWDSDTGGSLTTPVMTAAGILIGSSDGSLYLIDSATGKESWRYREGRRLSGLSSAPVVDGRQLLFVTNAGRLHSMVAPQEVKEWRKPSRFSDSWLLNGDR